MRYARLSTIEERKRKKTTAKRTRDRASADPDRMRRLIPSPSSQHTSVSVFWMGGQHVASVSICSGLHASLMGLMMVHVTGIATVFESEP